MCDNMGVYVGQHSRTLLTEPNLFANILIGIDDRSSRVSESSKDKPSQLVLKPNTLYAHAMMTDDNSNKKKLLEVSVRT